MRLCVIALTKPEHYRALGRKLEDSSRTLHLERLGVKVDLFIRDTQIADIVLWSMDCVKLSQAHGDVQVYS